MVSNICYFHPYLGKGSKFPNIFQMGWNRQLVDNFVCYAWSLILNMCIRTFFSLLLEYHQLYNPIATEYFSLISFLRPPLVQKVNTWLGSNFHPQLYVEYPRLQFLVALWNDLGWSQAVADSLSVGCACTTLGSLPVSRCRFNKVCWNIRRLGDFSPSISVWVSFVLKLNTTIAWLACFFLGIMPLPHPPNNEMKRPPGYGQHHSNWRLPGSSKMGRG